MQKFEFVSDSGYKWIDVVTNTIDEMYELADKFGLPPHILEDCLAPFHLPKVEKVDDKVFAIIRYYDENSKHDADTIQKLTNKIVFFITKEFVITIHRADPTHIQKLRDRWDLDFKSETQGTLLSTILIHTLHTYNYGIQLASTRLNSYEEAVFSDANDTDLIKKLYFIRRRVASFKQIFFQMKDVIEHYIRLSTPPEHLSQDLREAMSSLQFQSEDLNENVLNLLNLHLSLASHRMNDTMAVLTKISVFFIPLTFIAGLYGMNFKYMPELEYENGYPLVLASMLFTIIVVYIWFRKKKLM